MRGSELQIGEREGEGACRGGTFTVIQMEEEGAYHVSQMEESRSNTAIAEATQLQQKQRSNSSSRGSNNGSSSTLGRR